VEIVDLRDSSLDELNTRCGTIISACGYEARSSALVGKLSSQIRNRTAISFVEWPDALSRKSNDQQFAQSRFSFEQASGNDGTKVGQVLLSAIQSTPDQSAVAVDISCMTRAWHAGLVRTLRTVEIPRPVEVLFAYVPAQFSNPPGNTSAYEIVAPAEGFASLSPPDLPVATIIGLGYEREKALGLQQLLDPKRTILLTPRFRSRDDRFYPAVIKSNSDILARTSREWQFDYWIDEPQSTFGLLARLVAHLLPSYRVVLASLGPKLLGVLCFLVATRFPQVSVWRASSGAHGRPRQSQGDTSHTIVLSTRWMHRLL
jgi:hypothetical protein